MSTFTINSDDLNKLNAILAQEGNKLITTLSQTPNGKCLSLIAS